jgi:hypothetical protein
MHIARRIGKSQLFDRYLIVIEMNGEFVAKCSDGEYLTVPPCAAQYSSFFAALNDSLDDDFWSARPSESPPTADNPPPKNFTFADPETGARRPIRFVHRADRPETPDPILHADTLG